jgi:4-amino-4-deoxy-L-arabinose transferase-like glycosyltransferase
MTDVERATLEGRPYLPQPGPARQWIYVLAAGLVVAGALGLWLTSTSEATLREQLKVLQFWWLEATVLAVLLVGGLAIPAIRSDLDRRDLGALAALALVALGLTLFVAPRTNRIYYDEQIYQGVARNLSDLRRAQMCNDGTVEYGRLQCWGSEYNKQPYAYPHLLSVAFRAFGVGPRVAFAVNAAVMAASVVAIYLLTLLLFRDRTAAAFAGLVLALMPQQLLWSATTAVEPSASLAAVAAMLAAARFCDTRSSLALAGVAVASAWALQFRPESGLILLPVAVLLWQRARDEFRRPRLWWAGVLGFVLVAVHAAHLYAVRSDPWGAPAERLSLRYVADNLRVNGAFYLWDERFPLLVTVVAVAGLAFHPGGRSRVPLVVYFLAFFGIDLLFYAGSFNYGADVRYSLMTFPPLAVLAGLGLSTAARRLGETVPGVPARVAIAAALGFQFLWYAPLVRATTEEAWAARADVRFAEAVAPDLRGNRYVLTHNPSMFHMWGINAGQMSIVMANPSYLDYLASRYAGGVYLHWNFWCNVQDPAHTNLCAAAAALKPSEKVREHVERDHRFAFYRYDLPPAEGRDAVPAAPAGAHDQPGGADRP